MESRERAATDQPPRGWRDPEAPASRDAHEEFLRALSLSGDQFYVFDLDGRVLEANGEACRRTGRSREELLAGTIFDVSVRQTPKSFERLVASLREEGPQVLFGHGCRKGGDTFAVEARLWLAPRGDRPEAVWAQLRDVRGHDSLVRERDQLVELIEQSSEAIFAATPDGEIRYANRAGLELVGVDKLEDLMNRPLLELLPPGEHRDMRERVLPQVHKGRWEGEVAFLSSKTGRAVPCHIAAFPLRRTPTGRATGVALVARDVTLHKEISNQRDRLLQLNEVSREVATSLLENDDLQSAIGTILTRVGGILNVSRSYLCRYRRDRRLVFRTHEWNVEEDHVSNAEGQPEAIDVYAWTTQALKGGGAVRVDDAAETRVPQREESAILAADVRALLIMPVVIHGRLESFFGFVDTTGTRSWRDDEVAILQIIVDSLARAVERRISERERARIARELEEAAARERSASRYKSEFLAKISHELRTPMNAIVGYAELLGRPNVDPEKQGVWLGNIKRSTDFLLNLINDILDLSKIEAGQMTVDREPCSLEEMVSEIEELLRGWAEEKLLDLSVAYGDDLPASVETDPVRFKQVLINLVGNAIKFTPRGSVEIGVEAPPAQDGSREIRVTVRDTGVGIAREELENLFRPFAQVHGRGDSRFGGTGLGLDISRRLARLLGGDVEVESEQGVGSAFTFRFPLVEASGAPRPSSAARAGGTGRAFAGRRVLIVDDHADNREVLRFLLTEEGCTCETAENGSLGVRAALEAEAQGRPFDAILMDMSMPVMDGYAATAELVRNGLRAPIIALTAFAGKEDCERSLRAGCVAFLTKPIVPHLFFAELASHIGSSDHALAGPDPGRAGDQLLSNPRFAPLLARYVGSFPGLVETLRSARSEGRLEDARIHVHRLRGTAASYGFPALSRLAGACEEAIRAGRPGTLVAGHLKELEDRLLEVSRREGGG